VLSHDRYQPDTSLDHSHHHARSQPASLPGAPSALLISSTTPTATTASPNTASATRKTSKLPPSSALSRVKGFLPELARANFDLENAIAEHGRTEYDIEHLSDDEAPYIEMDLNVGVLEEQVPLSKDNIKLPGREVDNDAASAADGSSVICEITQQQHANDHDSSDSD